jgi:CheY-like chemotaxis protein
MKELAEWLIHIEHLAGDFYRNAADAFRNDEQLAGFLRHLAEEESWHGKIMEDIAGFLEKNRDMASAIALDEVTRDRIEAPFLDCGSRLGSDSLRREHIINCIVAAEFSEWNDIFVYVMNAVKGAGKDFAFTASKMQAHKRHIENFIGNLPEGKAYLLTMRRLPVVWQTRILVVEDYAGVRDFLIAVLSAEGDVDTAENGKEALEKTRERYYDVIVSDVYMPVMNGIEFFEAASRIDPRLAERFLVLTGYPTDETAEFIKKNRLRYLQKPMQLHDLTSAVKALLELHPVVKPLDRPTGRTGG